jgi:ligand-binding sensor domain-containing protein
LRFKKALFVVFFVLTRYFFSYAQEKPGTFVPFNDHYSFEQWNTENGLPQNNVTGIVQARDGYIWISTLAGLVRFDGFTFKVYDSRTLPGISSDFFINVIIDTNGTIYAFTSHEFVTISNNRLTVHPHTSNQLIATNNSTWCYSGDSVYRFEENRFKYVIHTNGETIDHLYSITDKIIVRTVNALYFLEGGKLNLIFKCPTSVSRKTHDALFDSRLKELNDSLQKLSISNPVIKKFGYSTFIGSEISEKLWRTPAGLVIERDSMYYTCFHSDGFPSQTPTRSMKDRDGNLWIGTYDLGLFRLNRKRMKTWPESPTAFMVYEDQQRNIYTGFQTVYKKSAGEKKFLSTNLRFYPLTMAEDSKHHLWFGTIAGEIMICDRRLNRIESLSPYITGMLSVYSLVNDNWGNMIVGSDKGIYMFTGSDYKNRVRSIDTGNYHAYQIYVKDKAIYAATSNGIVAIMNGKTSRIGIQQGLPVKEVRTVYMDNSNTLWAGTKGGGLVRIRGGKVFSFPFGPSMINENVWTIIEDQKEYFWMSSNSGVYRAKKSELNAYADGSAASFNVTRHDRKDGINNIEFNSRCQSKGFLASDGNIWLSSIGGAISFNPLDITDVTSDQKIYIESVEFDKNEYSFDSISEIPYGKDIRINFSYPWFKNQSSIKFEYCIRSIDREWKPLSDKRYIQLDFLQPGNYTVVVRLVGSDKTASVNFTITTPYYKAAWFVFLKYTLPLALLALFIILYMKKRQDARLKKMTQERKLAELEMKSLSQKHMLAELQMKALNAQMNPHFVFNCLSAVQNLFLQNQPMKGNEYLSRFASLLREMIEHIRSEKVSLKEEIDFLENYIILSNLMFDKKITYKIIVDPAVDQSEVFLPGIFLQPYVENAIQHGLQYLAGRDKELLISFTPHGNGLSCLIRDNGIGRAAADQRKEKGKHISRATEINEEASKVFTELEKMNIDVRYKDLLDENGLAAGTEVEITLIYLNPAT